MRREVIPKITTRSSAVLLHSIRIRLIKLFATQTLIYCIEVFVGIFVIVAIALIIRLDYRQASAGAARWSSVIIDRPHTQKKT